MVLHSRDEDMSARLRQLWATLTSSGWYALGLLLAGVVLVWITRAFGSKPDSITPHTRDLYGWGWALVVLVALLCVLSLVAFSQWDSRRRFMGGDRREQIKRLTTSLDEALNAIDAIRAQIDEDQHALDALESDLAARQEAARFSAEQIDAVTHLLRAESKRERRRSIVRDLALTLLGVLIGTLLQGGWPSWLHLGS